MNLNDVRNVLDIMSRNRIDVSKDQLAQYGRIFKQANITSDQYPRLIQWVYNFKIKFLLNQLFNVEKTIF